MINNGKLYEFRKKRKSEVVVRSVHGFVYSSPACSGPHHRSCKSRVPHCGSLHQYNYCTKKKVESGYASKIILKVVVLFPNTIILSSGSYYYRN